MVKYTKTYTLATGCSGAMGRLCLDKPTAYIHSCKTILPEFWEGDVLPKYKVTYEYLPKYDYTYKNKTYRADRKTCTKCCANPLGSSSARCEAWKKLQRDMRDVEILKESVKDTLLPDNGGGGGGGGDDEGDKPLDLNKFLVYGGIALGGLIVLSLASVGIALAIKKARAKKKRKK